MIFVTVGTHYMGFERLIKKMDEIAGEITEKVLMQVGSTEYEPVNAEWFKYKEIDELYGIYKSANIIVAHAGAGTLLDALKFQKSIVAVPRLKIMGEHIDDQQLELSEALENSGKVIAVYEIENLGDVLKNAKKPKEHSFKVNKDLSIFLRDFLRENLS